ncbi:MAG: ArsR/SmtB family transcription factor [Alphaproteobacteria bacterium]
MKDLLPLFQALSDPTRLAIVERLATEGEVGAGALHEDFNMSASAVSQHLKVLRDAGVIVQRSQGQARLYTLEKRALQRVKDWAIDHESFWNDSLDRLEAALDKTGEFGDLK